MSDDPRLEAVAKQLCRVEGNQPEVTDLVIYRSMADYILEAADEADEVYGIYRLDSRDPNYVEELDALMRDAL